MVKDTLAGLETAQKTELDELEEEIERRQYARKYAQAMRKRCTDRQKRRRAGRGGRGASKASQRSNPCTGMRSQGAEINLDREHHHRDRAAVGPESLLGLLHEVLGGQALRLPRVSEPDKIRPRGDGCSLHSSLPCRGSSVGRAAHS